jgi:hypothetical protein
MQSITDDYVLVAGLGDLVIIVLATGPKVRGFKPCWGRWDLRVTQSVARLPSEGSKSMGTML